MIITQEKRNTVVNGDWEITPFSIRATAKTFKTWSSDIYQHKVRAVIRELSCNAADAHKFAKNDNPFKVHLPTHLEQWFSIRDYGFGLTKQEMKEVFIIFFESTKEDTNDFIGSFGIGAKSFFSIAESAIVHSYQNGTKSSYSLFTDEDGLPQMASLMTCHTDEQDGLEIIVNTNRIDEFHNEAVNVYRWFDKLPLINSATVVAEIEEAKKSFKFQGDDFGFNMNTGGAKAIMGGVAYDIPHGYCIGLESYLNFEIGDLSVNPGRETLSIDDKTRDALYAKRDDLITNFKQILDDIIDAEETTFLKAKKLEYFNRGVIGNYTTKEQREFLTSKYKLPKPSSPITRYSLYNSRVSTNDLQEVPVGDTQRYFRFQPKFSLRIKQYVRTHRTSINVLTDEQIDECKIDLDVIENLDIMPQIERKKHKRIKVLSTDAGWGWQSSELDIDQEYVYVNMFRGKSARYAKYQVRTLLNYARDLDDVPVLYGLTTAVKKKGKGVELLTFIKSRLKKINKVLTKLPDYASILAVVDDRFKAKPIDELKLSIYTSCEMTPEHDDSLDKLEAEYLAAYPLIPHIGFDSSAIEAIKSYIQPLGNKQ